MNLAEIAARAEAATEGPWEVVDRGRSNLCINPPELDQPLFVTTGLYPLMEKENAAFIAHAREDIPALIAEVERLREENEAYGHRVGCLRHSADKEREHLTEKLEENDALRAQLETEILRRDSLDETLTNHKKDLATIREKAAPFCITWRAAHEKAEPLRNTMKEYNELVYALKEAE